ncbi:MAG: 1-acyl-sn-glycerol-3-phosphate acyltransferase [Chlamydiota bacterium]
MDFLNRLEDSVERSAITQEIFITLTEFFHSYKDALERQGASIYDHSNLLCEFLDMVEKQLAEPFHFDLFHKAITKPFDYYQFGLDFLRPLIIFSESRVEGEERIEEIEAVLAKGENVILLANHQTEPDPQAISLLLEKKNPLLAKNMIFVAGHRVTTDPLCVPLSMGRNLLCIFSKKHIEHDREKKQEKLQHNQRTMQMMGELLEEGGKAIYMAPSGGRDRPDANGQVDVAPFNPQSVEMFRLIAMSTKTKTHFYPLSLATYSLLPPPNSVDKELGEQRYTEATPIHLAFGAEYDMNRFDEREDLNKKEKRENRANEILQTVRENYQKLIYP